MRGVIPASAPGSASGLVVRGHRTANYDLSRLASLSHITQACLRRHVTFTRDQFKTDSFALTTTALHKAFDEPPSSDTAVHSEHQDLSEPSYE